MRLSSATRFSSNSTLSRSHCSRSVSGGAGLVTMATVGFAAVGKVLSSSALPIPANTSRQRTLNAGNTCDRNMAHKGPSLEQSSNEWLLEGRLPPPKRRDMNPSRSQ
jgi:hypothetical protein